MKRKFKRKKTKKSIKSIIIFTVILLMLGVIYVSYDIMEDRITHAIEYDDDLIKDQIDEAEETEEELEELEEVEIVEEEVIDDLDEAEVFEEKSPDYIDEKDIIIREKFQEGKVAYLTFDDGPSIQVTPMILETLKNREIGATFFVIGSMAEENPHVLNKIYEDGHIIGNHTYSHRYAYIYKNTKNFADDILKWEDSIRSILGQDFKSNIIRFPGGSCDHHKSYHKTAMDLDYEIFDWNVINGDGEGNDSSNEMLINSFKDTIQNKQNPIILMHDTDAKVRTAETLDEVIQYLLDEGYVFDTLNYFNKR